MCKKDSVYDRVECVCVREKVDCMCEREKESNRV